MHELEERNPLAGIRGRNLRDRIGLAIAAAERMDETEEVGLNPGQRLFFWLGQAARQLREEADVRPEAVAIKADVGKETVTRFEVGRTRPHEIDLMLAAYAECVGLGDPREIVVLAVRMWFEHGSAPDLKPTEGGAELEDLDRAIARQAQPPARGGAGGKGSGRARPRKSA